MQQYMYKLNKYTFDEQCTIPICSRFFALRWDNMIVISAFQNVKNPRPGLKMFHIKLKTCLINFAHHV